MTTINKATNDTLKEIAMFLRAIPSAPGANLDTQKQARALTKALTQARANIKDVEAYTKSFVPPTLEVAAEPEAEKPVVVPQTPLQSEELHGIKPEALNTSSVPQTPAESNVATIAKAGTYSIDISDKGEAIGSFKRDPDFPRVRDDEPVSYQSACFVNPTQLESAAAFIARKPAQEGNFTLELFRKV